jgi:cell division protein FtsN
MKKYLVLAFGLCVTMAFTSCKSSESAYKKAYEKAKQQELAQAPAEEAIEVAPVQTAPVQSAPAAATSAVVREEKVTVVSGNALKDFSVVCGSFGSQVNANNLKSELDAAGYSAVVAYNASNNMYRVIVSTHPTREAAAQARESFKARYANNTAHPDFQKAWLLYNIK